MEYLPIVFEDTNVYLPRWVIGAGSPHALIVAGVHGREHTGILVAFRLIERLRELNVTGRVEVLPVANPLAYAAGARETPRDGLNLGESFGDAEPRSITQAMARVIGARAKSAAVILDLHAAGEARYLPHALFHRADDAQLAASAGLPFAILRTKTREGVRVGTLASMLTPQQHGLTLELGGGMTIHPDDVVLGLRAVRTILARQGFVADSPDELPPTPPARVYPSDPRNLIRATHAGAFYPTVALGASVKSGEELGLVVAFDHLEPVPLDAPMAGTVIYLRMRPGVASGETLAMIIP
jgi:predicted deacylase